MIELIRFMEWYVETHHDEFLEWQKEQKKEKAE